MRRELHKDLEKMRMQVGAHSLIKTGITVLAINDGTVLRQAAGADDVLEQLQNQLIQLPVSAFTKESLRNSLDAIMKDITLGELVDIILEFAKLIEVYEPLEILRSLELLGEGRFSAINAADQQTAIVESYFAIQPNQKVFSGRIGNGYEMSKLLNGATNTPLYVQDFAIQELAIAEVRFYLAGYTNVTVKQGNILTMPAFETERFDYLCDAPRFGYKPNTEEVEMLKLDARYNYFGVPTRGNADLGYFVAGLQALNEQGKGAFYFTTGTLTRGGADAKIRERIITKDVIEAIIEFPPGFFAPVLGISSVLVLVNKAKTEQAHGNILFVNAEALTETARKKTAFTEQGFEEILTVLKERKEVSGISKVVKAAELVDCELVPSRYVFVNEMELDAYGTVEVNLPEFEALSTVPLNEAATIFRGYNALPKDENSNGNVAMLKIADIVDGEIRDQALTRYELGGRVKLDNYRLQNGDIVLSIRGQLKVALFKSSQQDVLLSQNFIGIRCNKNFDPAFVKLYLESPIMQFIMHNKLTGSTVLNLPTKDIEEFRIPLVPYEQQVEIVKVYEAQRLELHHKLAEIMYGLKHSKLHAFEQMGIGGTFKMK